MSLYRSPTTNFWSTTLNGTIDASVQTITLNSTSGLRAPGVLVIDRQDSSGNNTPNSREVISYTGISGSDITGVTRAFSGSTARSHSTGALVEATLDTTMWDNFISAATVVFTPDGVLRSVLSPVSIARAELTQLALSSVASVNTLFISTNINASGASVVGFSSTADPLTLNSLNITSTASIALMQSNTYAGLKGQFTWNYSGTLVTSLATAAGDTHLPFLRARKNLTINSVWAGVNSAPSLYFLECNFHYKSTPTATFSDVLTNFLYVDIGEPTSDSAATVASLALTSLASGTLIYPSIAKHGNAGDLTLVMACTERQ